VCHQGDCDWLYDNFIASSSVLEAAGQCLGQCVFEVSSIGATVLGVACPLTGADFSSITALCSSEPTVYSQLHCAAEQISHMIELLDANGDTYVCRHYAECMETLTAIGGLPGIAWWNSDSTVARYSCTEGGHTYNRYPLGNGWYAYIDAYNGIELRCPFAE